LRIKQILSLEIVDFVMKNSPKITYKSTLSLIENDLQRLFSQLHISRILPSWRKCM